MNDETHANELARRSQFGLLIVAVICILFALLHVVFPEARLDDTTAMFLALAIVALVIHQVTKFKGFGIEIEKAVIQLKADVKSVEVAVGGLEKNVGPGSKSASPAAATDISSVAAAAVPDAVSVDPEDPNKGQFGSLSERNGRALTATIQPIAGPKSSQCQVDMRIVSTDPARPLTGMVKLHLHPTFGRWSHYDIQSKGGVAQDRIVSYGAFTVGAEADGGRTRLELDLADVPGGTSRFYEQ